MIGAIRPFGVFPGVLVGKDGFDTFQEWQRFIKEIFERAEKGGVVADFGLQNAISSKKGFLEANQVLKSLAKKNLLYRWPKQVKNPTDSNSIFQSLIEGAETEPLYGIVSPEANTTSKPPPSTHPKELSKIKITDESIEIEKNWWSQLLQQEFVFEKTLENYKKILLPLAKIGGHLEVWDAYFNPTKTNYRHWIDLLAHLAKNSKASIEINTSDKALEIDQGRQMDFHEAMEPLKRSLMPRSNRLVLNLLNQKKIPDGFHDRFIFTRNSISLQLSWGTDKHPDHQQTCVILSSENAKTIRSSLRSSLELCKKQTMFL
ncbi:MAG: hypothetical protein EBZ47_07535 [Chlamydiae bacterium]|nr:hypothetical protein [Chlamydiota bacterium]